jgi:hypothetical protein
MLKYLKQFSKDNGQKQTKVSIKYAANDYRYTLFLPTVLRNHETNTKKRCAVLLGIQWWSDLR